MHLIRFFLISMKKINRNKKKKSIKTKVKVRLLLIYLKVYFLIQIIYTKTPDSVKDQKAYFLNPT